MSTTPKWTDPNEEWLTPAQAGRRFPGGISATSIRTWAADGRIHGAFQSPTGRWKIPLSSLMRFLNEK